MTVVIWWFKFQKWIIREKLHDEVLQGDPRQKRLRPEELQRRVDCFCSLTFPCREENNLGVTSGITVDGFKAVNLLVIAVTHSEGLDVLFTQQEIIPVRVRDIVGATSATGVALKYCGFIKRERLRSSCVCVFELLQFKTLCRERPVRFRG